MTPPCGIPLIVFFISKHIILLFSILNTQLLGFPDMQIDTILTSFFSTLDNWQILLLVYFGMTLTIVQFYYTIDLYLVNVMNNVHSRILFGSNSFAGYNTYF